MLLVALVLFGASSYHHRAILGVIMAITLPGGGWSDRENIGEMFGHIDQALGLLEAGLPL